MRQFIGPGLYPIAVAVAAAAAAAVVAADDLNRDLSATFGLETKKQVGPVTDWKVDGLKLFVLRDANANFVGAGLLDGQTRNQWRVGRSVFQFRGGKEFRF